MSSTRGRCVAKSECDSRHQERPHKWAIASAGVLLPWEIEHVNDQSDEKCRRYCTIESKVNRVRTKGGGRDGTGQISRIRPGDFEIKEKRGLNVSR